MAQYVNGSVAVKLDALEQEELESTYGRPAPRFTVLPGSQSGRLPREQAERALSPLAVTLAKCIAAFVCVLAVASLARIMVVALAFGYASSNNDMLTQLDEARSLGSELEIQQSVYGNPERIASLAIDAYGMVYAESTAVVDASAYVPTAADEAVAPVAADDGVQTE